MRWGWTSMVNVLHGDGARVYDVIDLMEGYRMSEWKEARELTTAGALGV